MNHFQGRRILSLYIYEYSPVCFVLLLVPKGQFSFLKSYRIINKDSKCRNEDLDAFLIWRCVVLPQNEEGDSAGSWKTGGRGDTQEM